MKPLNHDSPVSCTVKLIKNKFNKTAMIINKINQREIGRKRELKSVGILVV